MIDEAVRYKVVCLCNTKDAKTLAKVMLLNWFRYFGPPKVLRSDQEGGIRSEEFARVCDRYSIHRQLAGSDDSGQHTQTGLPEKHIQLVKLSAMKCQHQCEAQGLDIDTEDIVVECAMSQNFQLEYGGFTPAQGVIGHNPRGLYETGTNSLMAHSGAADTSPDYFEAYLRMRLLAKVSIQQAIIESRIAEANNSRPMKLDHNKLRPLQDQVDLYRLPDKKGESGWRGPCELLDISMKDNTAIVKHQSLPYIVPVRHIRPHIASALYTYLGSAQTFFQSEVWSAHKLWPQNASGDLYKALHTLLDKIDKLVPGTVHTQGCVLTKDGQQKYIPPDFLTQQPREFACADLVAREVLIINDVAAIVMGTELTSLILDYSVHTLTLVMVARRNRQSYFTRTLQVQGHVKLKRLVSNPEEYSLLGFIRHNDEEEPDSRFPNLDDISRIEWEDEDDDSPPSSPNRPHSLANNNPADWWNPSPDALDSSAEIAPDMSSGSVPQPDTSMPTPDTSMDNGDQPPGPPPAPAPTPRISRSA